MIRENILFNVEVVLASMNTQGAFIVENSMGPRSSYFVDTLNNDHVQDVIYIGEGSFDASIVEGVNTGTNDNSNDLSTVERTLIGLSGCILLLAFAAVALRRKRQVEAETETNQSSMSMQEKRILHEC